MLITDWFFSYPGYEPLPCQAPCTMFSVLYDHGKIPDPFFGLNEQTLQHLSRSDCSFTAVFPADETILAREYVELTFYGLDTLCRITLNGKKLDSVKNMHRIYTYDVKALLVPGENTLQLDFESPVRYFAREQHRHYLYMNGGDTIPGTAHLRTAFYQSGWDWGPTLQDMGIFRPVELRGYDTDRLSDMILSQEHHDSIVDVKIRAWTEKQSGCSIFATLDGKRVPLQGGEAVIRVEQPRLWWVRGYGEQNLYGLTLELVSGETVLDTKHMRIGLRTLTVSTEPDADKQGNEFCFVINGVKIFAMGANYIPMDSMLSRVTPQRLDALIDCAIDANFNTLRVWGGGYYPEDHFYDLCDEKGILVWQDFMVACANIWLTEEMEAQFRQESRDNLLRIQHHASLGLLCGNNEMEDMILNAGVQNTELVRMDYLKLYEHILAEASAEYSPDTYYWPSSPSSGGGFDDPGSYARGDTHYCKVWHGGVPYTAYRQEKFRFCSEYGFESFPSMKTVKAFAAPKDWNCFSRVMENHQKCKGGNGNILRYLSNNYLYPGSFENLVYASQLLQADAISYGVEHFRRLRGYCMGSIYWQFNDCWPVASWSSVDYFGRYKALHYAARRFYAPVAMGLFLEKGELTVNVSNETMRPFRGSITVSIKDQGFTLHHQETQDISVKRLSSKDVFTMEIPEMDPYHDFISVELFGEARNFLTRRVEMLVPPKHFDWRKPELKVSAAETGNGLALSVSCNTFTKGVFLDFRDNDWILSDNFFPITDETPCTVLVCTDRSARDVLDQLTVKTVYDIR